MFILAIDTSMGACSAAVLGTVDERVIASRYVEMERGHAEALPPMAQQVVEEAGVTPAELCRIAVTTGPGTFTGVRIGLAFARGLGQALGIPVIGIDSLRAIAANEESRDKPIMVAAHARNSEAYVAAYDAAGAEITGPRVMKIDSVPASAPQGAVLLGTAADDLLKLSGRPDLIRSQAGDLPSALRFGFLTRDVEPPPAMPTPLYLRAPDAKPQPQVSRPTAALNFTQVGMEGSALLSRLHASCFEEPWTGVAFQELLATPGTSAVVANQAGNPVGFLVTRSAADETEIITVGVLPSLRHRGIAKAMIQHQFSALAAAGARIAFIEVASSNAAAQALYRSLGFAGVGVRRGYYPKPGQAPEDAIVMRRTLAA